MPRFLGLALNALVFFALLLSMFSIFDLAEERQRVMAQFYLSIALVLVFSYMLSSAGRGFGLARSSGGGGIAGALQKFGFPLTHLHAWGDFGRLYALLFLGFVGPVIGAGFVVLIAAGFVDFEGTVPLSQNGSEGLTESEAIRRAASGDLPMSVEDTQKTDQVFLYGQVGYVLTLIALLPCLARLLPFFFWRSGGRAAATLAQTWRAVSWRLSLIFGWSFGMGLAGLMSLGSIDGFLVLVFFLSACFLALWAAAYAWAVQGLKPLAHD